MNEGRWDLTTGYMVMGVAPPSGQQHSSPFASSRKVTYIHETKHTKNPYNVSPN